MNPTLNSFLFADLILFLFLTATDTFISDPIANKICKIVIVIVCLLLAFFGSLVIHLG